MGEEPGAATFRHSNQPWKFSTPSEVLAGQIRQLRSYDDPAITMLVLVVSVDEGSSSALVVNAVSPAEEATVRDLVMPRNASGLPFDCVFRVDGPARAWCVQLSGTRLLGFVSYEVVDLAARLPRLSVDYAAAAAGRLGLEMGALRPQTGDHLWWSVGRATERLAGLASECTESMASPLVADPAILSSLVLRGNKSDKLAVTIMGEAIAKREAENAPEGWASLGKALSQHGIRDQDSLRLLQRNFLEDALRAHKKDLPESEVPEVEEIGLARNLPGGFDYDPLTRVIQRHNEEGQRGTRVWTARHLWAVDATNVMHASVNHRKHAVVPFYEPDSQKVAI